jgi:hypothetical protein
MVTSFKPEWRDNAIAELVSNDYDTIMNGGDDYLYGLLSMGFKGYGNMFDAELEQELIERDISTVFGDNDD